jgi:hypothetical protein
VVDSKVSVASAISLATKVTNAGTTPKTQIRNLQTTKEITRVITKEMVVDPISKFVRTVERKDTHKTDAGKNKQKSIEKWLETTKKQQLPKKKTKTMRR